MKPNTVKFVFVFPAETLKEGNSYHVTIQAYDRNDAAIEDATCEFTLKN